jgi:hypothetical protein
MALAPEIGVGQGQNQPGGQGRWHDFDPCRFPACADDAARPPPVVKRQHLNKFFSCLQQPH